MMRSLFRRSVQEEHAAATGFVDIHCHMLPGIDDGANSVEEALAMAGMAVADGITTVILTPHQLGAYRHNSGDEIRRRVAEFQQVLTEHGIPLRVLPGADVRIEPDMVDRLIAGDVLTLGDFGRHVLLELPHELYFPLEPVLDQLHAAGMVGILSHPERNRGLLREPEHLPGLVQRGCLMQITASSLTGTFGSAARDMAEWMLAEGLVHFIATDAHGSRSRRPLLNRAFERAIQLAGHAQAAQLCRENPGAVATGCDVGVPREAASRRRSA